MGIFSRIGEIINANINSMLEKAEDPQKMVRLMIHEMEDTLTEVKSSAAEVIAERIRVGRQLKTLRGYHDLWEEKAALAVEKGRDDLAREALERKLGYQVQVKEVEKRLREAEKLVKHYQADIARLEEKLQSAHRRQKELIARKKRAEHRKKVEEKIYQINTTSAFAKYEAYSERIDRLEAEAEVNFVQSESLEKKFHELEHAGEIEAELKALKRKNKKS